MADTLPSIDFGFNDLRERMTNFTVRFDDFIERGRKRVLEEKNTFRMNVAELADAQQKRRHHIQEFESKSSVHAETLEKEAQETREMHEAIRSLTSRKEEQLVRRDELKADIAAVQGQIRQRRDAQGSHQRALDAQARHNIPELRFWEHCMGLRIDGAGGDMLRILFSCVDSKDPNRECWFELDTAEGCAGIGTTKPKLEQEEIDCALERFRETSDLGAFLKAMRTLFVNACKA